MTRSSLPPRQLADVARDIGRLREEIQLLSVFARQLRDAAIAAEIAAHSGEEERR
jgi:hypothetical protein